MADFQRGHKIKLRLSHEQFAYCARSAGVSRFAYNWALAQWKILYQEFKEGVRETPPSEGELRKLFNQQKKIDKPANYDSLPPEQQRQFFPWVTEVSKYCPQQAIQDLGIAFKKFFKKESKYPQFKKRGVGDSFYIGNDAFNIVKKNGIKE